MGVRSFITRVEPLAFDAAGWRRLQPKARRARWGNLTLVMALPVAVVLATGTLIATGDTALSLQMLIGFLVGMTFGGAMFGAFARPVRYAVVIGIPSSYVVAVVLAISQDGHWDVYVMVVAACLSLVAIYSTLARAARRNPSGG